MISSTIHWLEPPCTVFSGHPYYGIIAERKSLSGYSEKPAAHRRTTSRPQSDAWASLWSRVLGFVIVACIEREQAGRGADSRHTRLVVVRTTLHSKKPVSCLWGLAFPLRTAQVGQAAKAEKGDRKLQLLWRSRKQAPGSCSGSTRGQRNDLSLRERRLYNQLMIMKHR